MAKLSLFLSPHVLLSTTYLTSLTSKVYCQAQPQPQLQLSLAEIALKGQIGGEEKRAFKET